MGQLIDGEWHDDWYDTAKTGGAFKRSTTAFRNWVTADGEAGPSGEGGFPAESGRYHLYVSLACPWAHRALIMRALKGLEEHIGVSVVHTDMLSEGWTFADDRPGTTGDKLYGLDYLREIYTRADPKISGRVTVPVLWDTQAKTIVSNESSEIIRMMNAAWNGITGNQDDYYPEALRGEIDAVNERVYDTVNNGVYKAGFATTQAAYDAAVTPLFESLAWLETLLEGRIWLVGEDMTEADIRLFTTLVRFDSVYHGHFKCNRHRIVDLPNLWRHTRRIFQMEAVRPTVELDHVRRHYHYSHESVNPHRIVPIGPEIDWDEAVD